MNAKDKDGLDTSLHWAAQCGHDVIVEKLIVAKADVNEPMSAGRFKDIAPLMCAAQNGHTDVVELLLKNG